MKNYKYYDIKLNRVHDGDTIIADIGLGFDLWLSNQKIRLARINAPEMEIENLPNPLGEKSRLFLENLITGKALQIETNCRKEKFGRWLCEVLIVEDKPFKLIEKSVSSIMIESGNAIIYKGLNLDEISEDDFYNS